MPHFVCLFDWTDQGSKTVTDTVERVGSASEMAQSKYGVTLEHIYWTVGAHDLVGVQRTRVSVVPAMSRLGAVWTMSPIQVLWKRRVG